VDIDELGPGVTAARIEIAVGGQTRQVTTRLVTTRLADGLALAVAAGAPIRVASTVLDRLAVADDSDDLFQHPPGRGQQAGPPQPPPSHHRYLPGNLAFADGLDRWELSGGFRHDPSGSHWQDYRCAAENGAAVLAASVPEPAGFAALGQRIFADDYRGAAVVFRGEVRCEDVTGHAGVFLRVVTERQFPRLARGPRSPREARDDPANHLAVVSGGQDWCLQEVSAQIPGDAAIISFGLFLNGPGQVRLRNAELALQAQPSAR
jgi:hypothetical protein